MAPFTTTTTTNNNNNKCFEDIVHYTVESTVDNNETVAL